MEKNIRINIRPLSINKAYKGKRFRTPEYNAYKKALHCLLPKITLPEPPYAITFKFGYSSMASDWDNCIKPAQDCIAEKYGFNDKLIHRGVVDKVKVEKGKEFFEFKIESFNGKITIR